MVNGNQLALSIMPLPYQSLILLGRHSSQYSARGSRCASKGKHPIPTAVQGRRVLNSPWLIRIGSLDDCKNAIFLDETAISSVQRSRNKCERSRVEEWQGNGGAWSGMQGMEGQSLLDLSLSNTL